MKTVFVAIFLVLGFSSFASAQDDVAAKHAAYYQCINNIEIKPVQAYGYCSAYLKQYPNDDKRLVDFAGMFTTAFEKVDRYLKSIPDSDFVDSSTWSIYKPDLQKTIPYADESKGAHSISITREYNSSNEEKLLNKAEAVYGKRGEIAARMYKEWRYLSQESLELPVGEPKWWNGSSDSILSTELVTTSAVLYYYNLSNTFRVSENQSKENSFSFSHSELKYVASIKLFPRYERSGKSFENVYVADMTLTWGQTCGGLCGAGFTRNKVVVLKPNGEILHVFLDSPENSRSWVS